MAVCSGVVHFQSEHSFGKYLVHNVYNYVIEIAVMYINILNSF